MDNIFGSWFSSSNFSGWKLHTVWDYVFFGLIVLLGVILIVAATKYLSSRRTPAHANRRTARRLARLCGGQTALYLGKSFQGKNGESMPVDLLWVTSGCVYTVKVLHFGLTISGNSSGREWICADRQETVHCPNPLHELNAQRRFLNRLLSDEGLRGVNVMPLVVFADNYGEPSFTLTGVDCATTLRKLKKWFKDRPPIEKGNIDVEAVKDALTRLSS